MKIAIIDSGIHPNHPHVGTVAGGICIAPRGETNDYLDRLGHGTAVAGAIREKAPGAELYAVKLFDRALSANIDVIIRAIEWSIVQRVDVINLSLGTANPAHRARFEAALAGDAVVVSAFEHNGAPLLPGSMPGVIASRSIGIARATPTAWRCATTAPSFAAPVSLAPFRAYHRRGISTASASPWPT